MQAGHATRAVARFGGVAVVLLVTAALAVILVSFLVQQHERIATARDERRGLESARPVARLLDRLVRTRVLSAQSSAGDPGARYRFAVARRAVLDAFEEVRALQIRNGRRFDTADDFADLERKLAILMPRHADGGMQAQRAYGALTGETVRLLAGIGDGSRLILDAEAETFALIDAAVTQLPALMHAGGGAVALHHLPRQRARRAVDLAVAKGTVESSLGRLKETLGQRGRVAVDEEAQRELREPLLGLTWAMTSLMADLTAPQAERRRLRVRSATAPMRTYDAWTTVADHLSWHLEERIEALERRDRLVKAAAALLLLLGLIVFAAHQRQRRRLRRAEEDRDRMELELQVASKLEAVGQLAAGVAHEINTPIQFVGDSVRFLDGATGDLLELVGLYRSELAAAGGAVDRERIEQAEEQADLEYIQERIPPAFERTFDGVERVSTIVTAMKSFSHTTGGDMAEADLNDAIQTTLVVCANEYKYVARLETDLADLPSVTCHIGDLNQVVLNLVVNAAHAIEDGGGDEPGTIAVRTALEGDDALITVSDTGPGIPDHVRHRIFEPFFTTKEVGRGSGQGLALARSIVVDKHGGSIEVETAPGTGTTFVVRVPLAGTPAAA